MSTFYPPSRWLSTAHTVTNAPTDCSTTGDRRPTDCSTTGDRCAWAPQPLPPSGKLVNQAWKVMCRLAAVLTVICRQQRASADQKGGRHNVPVENGRVRGKQLEGSGNTGVACQYQPGFYFWKAVGVSWGSGQAYTWNHLIKMSFPRLCQGYDVLCDWCESQETLMHSTFKLDINNFCLTTFLSCRSWMCYLTLKTKCAFVDNVLIMEKYKENMSVLNNMWLLCYLIWCVIWCSVCAVQVNVLLVAHLLEGFRTIYFIPWPLLIFSTGEKDLESALFVTDKTSQWHLSG